MINIDKVIDEYNDTLDERIAKEQLKQQFESKLKDGTKNDTITVSTADSNISFYQVFTPIKENDQTRIIKFMANDLLNALGLPERNIDREIELKVKVVGRDCDKYGQPINID